MVGQAKRYLQIMSELGFIDPNLPPREYYTVTGRKDRFGNVICETSLNSKMESLRDFIGEETLLQYHGWLVGLIVDRTPKCHLEMAGEGIGYSWGCAKGYYRRLLLSEKRQRRNSRSR